MTRLSVVLVIGLLVPSGASAAGLDGLGFETSFGSGGGVQVFILGTEQGDTGVARNGASEFLQGGGDWSATFTYVVTSAVDTAPAMPGYLSEAPLTDFDPTGLVASTDSLRIQFTVSNTCTGVIFNYGHYGSEPDFARALNESGQPIGDGTRVIPAGAEDAWILSDNEDPFTVPAGTYFLRIDYDGDDPMAPNSEDNGHYIDFIEMTADAGCQLGD